MRISLFNSAYPVSIKEKFIHLRYANIPIFVHKRKDWAYNFENVTVVSKLLNKSKDTVDIYVLNNTTYYRS